MESITDLSNYSFFHTPGRPNLKQGIRAYSYGTADVLTDAQLVVLTLNEICVLQGRGQVLWYPSYQ